MDRLHYGAAQACVTCRDRRVGQVTCVLGRNGVGKTSLLDAASPASIRSARAPSSSTAPTSPGSSERAPPGAASPMCRRARNLSAAHRRGNLKTGFAPLKREDRSIPDDRVRAVPVLTTCWGGVADLSGGQQQQLAIGGRW